MAFSLSLFISAPPDEPYLCRSCGKLAYLRGWQFYLLNLIIPAGILLALINSWDTWGHRPGVLLAWFLVAIGLPPLLFAFGFKLEVLAPEDPKWTTHEVMCRRWCEFFVNFVVRNWPTLAAMVLFLLSRDLKDARLGPEWVLCFAWAWIALNGLCIGLALLFRLFEKPTLTLKPKEVKIP